MGAPGTMAVGSKIEPSSRPGANRMRAPMIPTAIAVIPGFMKLLVAYFETALATFAADASAALSSTKTVIFMPPWPSPQ